MPPRTLNFRAIVGKVDKVDKVDKKSTASRIALIVLAVVFGLGGLVVGALGAFVILFIQNGGPHGSGLQHSGFGLAGGCFLLCTVVGLALAARCASGVRSPRASTAPTDQIAPPKESTPPV